MIFQALAHIMKEIILTKYAAAEGHDSNYAGAANRIELFSATSVQLLSATLEALNSYISNFNVCWSDSLETIFVLPMLQKLLTFSNLPPRVS